MKKIFITISILLITMISGCLLVSLYPIYTPETLIRPDWLEGKWMNKDSLVWSFEIDTNRSDESKLYKLITDETVPAIRENSKKENLDNLNQYKLSLYVNEFEAGITKINKNLFMDLMPWTIDPQSEFYEMHYINAHSISKMEFKDDTLWVSTITNSWAKNLSAKQRKKYGIIDTGKQLILSSKTSQLRAFLAKMVNDTNVFPIRQRYFTKIKN